MITHLLNTPAPTILQVIGVTYCISSIFCSIGIELFGGKIYDGAPAIKGEQRSLGFRFLRFISQMSRPAWGSNREPNLLSGQASLHLKLGFRRTA